MISHLPSFASKSHGLLQATDAEHGIMVAHERLPTTRSALTLLLAKEEQNITVAKTMI